MMRLFIFGFICQITVADDQFGLHFHPPETDDSEILKASESRYHSNPDYPDRDYRNYNNRIPGKEFDLPVTFKAPHYDAHDYWRTRRTFFDDYNYDKTTVFPGFYQFMTSIFGGRDRDPAPEHPDRYHYHRSPPTPPYSFDPPYNFRPTEPNFIPPPKPIRASVIKLETITRSPIYPSFESTPKYYPHPEGLLNQVLIENSKAIHQEPKIPAFKPLPVLPKPGHVSPTTLKPNYNHSVLKYHNDTDYKYPDSVQDQLPNFDIRNVRIPYVSEKPIPQIFSTFPTESPQGYGKFFPPNSRATSNVGLIDIRSLNPEGFEFGTTTVKSFPGAVEKVKRPVFKYTKKLTAQLDKSSVERVANLTVLGFSKPEKESNAHKQVNYLNVKDLINYEMGRFENLTKQNDSINRLVNLNDELSLDAKILKDTNWDGLTVLSTSTTEETTTLITTTQAKLRNKTAFWEIINTTPVPETTTDVTTIRTTTEFIPWPSTLEPTESTTTEETTTKKIPEQDRKRLDNINNPEIVTSEPEITISVRRYSRRPKVVNFTPYPSPEEIQKKLTNRNHFPKRQKPNITLAFGNKNVLKNRSVGKEEVTKFSEEDLRKRRKIGKRRQVFKRVRVVTSERPILN